MAAAAAPAPTIQFASLYVGDLHPQTTEAILHEAFSTVGAVASCRVCRDSVTRRSLLYGYVNYHNVEDAEKAIDGLNYSQIKGKACRIMWSQRDPSWRKNATGNVFVKNLDESIDNKALHDTFSIFGNILSCKVANDANGTSKGYGFVHYESEEAAQQAIDRVNGMQIGNRTVYVGIFMKRSELESQDDENFTNLYIKNLPLSWDDTKLASLFGEHGEIVSSVLMTNAEGERFALVNYKESASAKAAIAALHSKDVTSDMTPEERATARGGKKAAGGVEGAEAKAEGAEGEAADAAPDAAPDAGPDAAPDAAAEAAAEVEAEPFLLYVQRALSRAERQAEAQAKRQEGKGAGKPQGVRLCIRNLHESTTSEQLRALFEPFGTVLSGFVKTNEDGNCRGLGFVVLSSVDEATKAVSETHLRVVDGRPLNVGLAERRRTFDGQEEGDAKGGKGKGGKGKGKGGTSRKGGKGANVAGLGPLPPAPQPPFPGFPGFPGFPLGPRPPTPGVLPPPMPGAALGLLGYPPAPYGAPGYPGALPGAFSAYPPPAGIFGGYAPAALHSLPPAMSGKGLPGRGLPPPTMPGVPPYPGLPGLPGLYGLPGVPQMLLPGMPPPRPGPQPLTRERIAHMQPHEQKQALGEAIFPLVQRLRPDLGGKITGMMLEMTNDDILVLLSSEQRLRDKVAEAVALLEKR